MSQTELGSSELL